MADITAIILTRNEEDNIGECIRSITPIVKRIVVVDSYSEDKTVEIAKKLGAEVFQHEFINHAKQYKYAEKIANVNTIWTFRIDADERLTRDSASEIEELCVKNRDTNINGIYVRFCNIFMGKPLKHGGVYPWLKMCIYKTGKGGIEDRNMDEHLILYEGKSICAKKDSMHYAFRSLAFFINKFNWYSTKEAFAYFEDATLARSEMDFKTFIKTKIYYRLPMGVRAWLFYAYRYYFRLGFLDGKEGRIYAFLHAYWYRFLIDAKIYEHKKLNKDFGNIGALK